MADLTAGMMGDLSDETWVIRWVGRTVDRSVAKKAVTKVVQTADHSVAQRVG